MTREIAVVALTRSGARLARRVAVALPGALVHGFAPRIGDADVAFASTTEHLRSLFADGQAIVAVMATGILVRALAPLIGSKREDPPVLALSADGTVVVPLLGGHHGANRLARRVAEALDGRAAITTASDAASGTALDDPPDGWRVRNPEAAKALGADLLAGEPVQVIVEAGDAAWLTGLDLDPAPGARRAVRITDRAVGGSADELVLHPPVLALGVGCERGVPEADLIDHALACLADAGLAREAVACVASIDIKADEPAVHALAHQLGVPARFFPADALKAEGHRLATPSEIVAGAVGVAGVAEAAALAVVGEHGSLVVPKRIGGRVTCAVARSPVPIDATAVGRGRGLLRVVGLGPGTSAWRCPAASRALAIADDVVGYALYLDLIGPSPPGQRRHAFPIGAEEERVAHALTLAAEGRSVALVASGDPGIYALASLVFEAIERGPPSERPRIDVEIVPGISALQAAAALSGAPLGHDFCAISLSDLMTPWPAIERRLLSAAEADFVTALYNPVSRRRRTGFERALAIFRAHRPPSTPIVIARNLGRTGQTVTLRTLDSIGVDDVDMLTVVLVGSTATRTVEAAGRRWVYTPRGYGVGRGGQEPE